MRRFLVAGNWKMNGSSEMTADLISGIARRALEAARLSEQRELAYDILVCPAAPYLRQATINAESQPISIGAQNVSQFDSGAYTGEMSLAMLSEIGCEYVLLGHSERRELFKETDQDIAEKFSTCINSAEAIVPVLCIGETLADRKAGNTEKKIAAQLDAVLDKTGVSGFANAVIAYEPVWAIGTGETASPQQAQEVHAYIRAKLRAMNVQIAESIRIVYGGSVKPDNAADLFAQEDIDGGLIGGASLSVESFAGICEAVQTIVEKT